MISRSNHSKCDFFFKFIHLLGFEPRISPKSRMLTTTLPRLAFRGIHSLRYFLFTDSFLLAHAFINKWPTKGFVNMKTYKCYNVLQEPILMKPHTPHWVHPTSYSFVIFLNRFLARHSWTESVNAQGNSLNTQLGHFGPSDLDLWPIALTF